MSVSVDGQQEERHRSLEKALINTGTSVICCDTEYRITWVQNLPVSWTSRSVVGEPISSLLPPQATRSLTGAAHRACESSACQKIEISFPDPHGPAWFALWIDCDRRENGRLAGFTTTAIDITDQKRREQILKTLLREVSHRSKNLLAIIQSIATQTGRHAETIEGFVSRFRGRLHSLASTQDLVTSSDWRGASLPELVHSQVEEKLEKSGGAIDLTAESIYLSPNAALHIGLALHELAANSVSFGALSSPEGRVQVIARRQQGVAQEPLTLEWTEPLRGWLAEPRQKGFGSVALEKVVPASLGGTATLDISNTRLTYRLTIPAGNFEHDRS